MQYFCMGCLYMDMGSSGTFGGISRAKEMGFPFVGGGNDSKIPIIRARVFEGKLKHKIIRGNGVVCGFLGSF